MWVISLNSGASKGGMKVGRMKDPLYMGSSLGIVPPIFIPLLEPFDKLPSGLGSGYYLFLGDLERDRNLENC